MIFDLIFAFRDVFGIVPSTVKIIIVFPFHSIEHSEFVLVTQIVLGYMLLMINRKTDKSGDPPSPVSTRS